MVSVLKANIHYMKTMKEMLFGKRISSLEYNLIRKELFVSTANLSAALHRMLSEPKSKQKHQKEIYEFVVLNHVLSSNIASLAETMVSKSQPVSKEIVLLIKRTITNLEKNLLLLDNTFKSVPDETDYAINNIENARMDFQLNDQLHFICKVSEDIGKVSKVIAG